MQHLDKRDKERRDEAMASLNAAYARMKEAWVAVAAAVEEYNAKVAEYNSALESARGWAEDCSNAIDSYMGERSEKWHEGDRAQEFESWKSEFDDAELEDIEPLDVSEFEPTEDLSPHAVTLENLSEQPG